MGLDTVTPIQAGLLVLAVGLGPAAIVFALTGLSNLSVRFWRSRLADSNERDREIQP
jgi:hypothetical protein